MHRLATMIAMIFAIAVAAFLSAEDGDRHSIPEGAKVILEKSTTIELISLDPVKPPADPKDVKGAFHGWKVLGRTVIKAEDARKKLVETFEKGVDEYKAGPSLCFQPRHGVRVTHDDKTVDFVICFQCFQVRVIVGGEKEETFLISRSPAGALNAILKKGDVPLAEQPEE